MAKDAFWGYMLSMSIDYFSFFLFVSLVAFLLLLFVSFIIVVDFCPFFVAAIVIHFLHFVSMAMLIYGLIFCFPTCFFVYFSFGCSTGVVGKGDGGM